LSLNVKNEERHRLARELAALTGESMAAAVTKAMRERLERVRREGSGDLADRLKEPWRLADVDDLLYDEQGLSR
jgi:antitoxin VapB